LTLWVLLHIFFVRRLAMGSKFSDYVSEVVQTADTEQRALLDAFGSHFEAERRLHFDMPKMLVAARKRAGLNQQQLADLSGVGQSEISRIENGQGNPTLDTLDRIVGPLRMRVVIVDDAGQPLTPAQ
jgi:DNA-binding XRE family transcriptional regulator